MAYNVKINKVTYNNVAKQGSPLADGSGEAIFWATNDANGVSADVLTGKTVYGADGSVNGSMVNNGAKGYVITDLNEQTITEGYYNGKGKIKLDDGALANLTSGNIKSGVEILGVVGNSNVVDTLDATATASDIMLGQTAYVKGQKVTGELTVISASYDESTRTLHIS